MSWNKQSFKAGTIKIILELLYGKRLHILGLRPACLPSRDFMRISATLIGEPRSLAPSLGMGDGIGAWPALFSAGHGSQHRTEASAAGRAGKRFVFSFWPPVNSDNYQEINLRFSDERYFHQSARYREGCKEGASLAFSPWLQG